MQNAAGVRFVVGPYSGNFLNFMFRRLDPDEVILQFGLVKSEAPCCEFFF